MTSFSRQEYVTPRKATNSYAEQLVGFFSKPDVPRLKQEKNAQGLISALLYLWDSQISIDAAKALGEIRATEAIPKLAEYADSMGQNEELGRALIDALAAIGGDKAVEALVRLLASSRPEVVTRAREALLRFDTPLVQQAVASDERRQNVLRQLESAQGTNVVMVLPSADVGREALWAILIGGMAYGAPLDIDVTEFVRLPEKCALCGMLPGTKEVASLFSFQKGSAFRPGNIFHGSLRYQVCDSCRRSPLHQKAIAGQALFADPRKRIVLNVSVLNPEVAEEIRKLNEPAWPS